MSIDYIAVLDHDHLDNGMFLQSFADAVSSHESRGLIIHSDSRYTDRIMQTGVMREEAKIRSIKDLNHRLIALLADHGVSAIGLNGYQREMLYHHDGEVRVNSKKLFSLPEQPFLLLSCLIYSKSETTPVAASLPSVVKSLQQALKLKKVYLFTKSDDNELIKKDLPETLNAADDSTGFVQKTVPEEFHHYPLEITLTTARDFKNYPEIKNSTLLVPGKDPS